MWECVCGCSYLCGGSADDQELRLHVPRGQDLLSPRVTARPCRAKALALEHPLLMGCVNLDKLLSLSEPPFPHMLNASQGSSDPS